MQRKGLKRKITAKFVFFTAFVSACFLCALFFINSAGRQVEIKLLIIASLSAVFLFVVLAIGLSFFTANKIVKPIKEIEKQAKAFVEDGLNCSIKIKTNDEIEDLANVFNKMAAKLGRSRVDMEEARNVLAIKIKARTKELEELANELENKVSERTKQLKQRVNELERFHRLTVGRELKMIELKKELKWLKNGLREQDVKNNTKNRRTKII